MRANKKPPEPVEKWESVYDATKDGPLCPQPTTDPVSEDCLILNVYSTKLPQGKDDSNRSVIVFIHAGGYYSVGSVSGFAGPDYFLDQDIVLVTINYRLATLGFLNTGDKEAPGNNGLKDQVQALRWVKQNIKPFGGDPDNVTIMGYSAGGWSVILHMVSPMSKGLFHKAVAMSGSPIGQFRLPQNQLDLAKKQAKFVGCPSDTAANIIKCLKTKPFNELGDSLNKFDFKNRLSAITAAFDMPQIAPHFSYSESRLAISNTYPMNFENITEEFNYDPIIIWYPAIEANFGQERFLPADPIELIQSGKFENVPLITGVTTDEFGYKALGVLNNETNLKEINDDFDRVAPIAFLYERNTNRSKNISKALKSFYLHGKPVDKSQLCGLDHLYGDSVIGFPVHRAAKLLTKYNKASVYYYRFSYQGHYSHRYLPDTNIPYGVVHHDDLIYLFYISELFPRFNATSPPEIEMVEKLTTIYANFAKTGKPIPTPTSKLDNVRWEPFSLSEQKYMDIGHELKVKEKLYEERYAEWEKIFPLSY